MRDSAVLSRHRLCPSVTCRSQQPSNHKEASFEGSSSKTVHIILPASDDHGDPARAGSRLVREAHHRAQARQRPDRDRHGAPRSPRLLVRHRRERRRRRRKYRGSPASRTCSSTWRSKAPTKSARRTTPRSRPRWRKSKRRTPPTTAPAAIPSITTTRRSPRSRRRGKPPSTTRRSSSCRMSSARSSTAPAPSA